MSKTLKKKRKIKIKGLIIFLFVLFFLSLSIYYVLNVNIKNIVIKNTSYINDDEIIYLGKLENYPKFFLLNKNQVKKRIINSPYISNVYIKKKYGFILLIDVVENRPVFYDNNKNTIVFHNGQSTDINNNTYSFRIPRLINYVPDDKYKKFIAGMAKINDNIISKISDIEYQPNDYDKDRFLLYMDDGNMVYLTLTKFKMINHYNEVYKQLDNHKGILYLDSGNHFQIKE